MSYVRAAASVDPVPPDDMSSPKSPLETGQRWRPGGFWIFLGGVRRVADVTQEAPGNRRDRLHMAVDSLLNDYGVAYSTNAVTWGRTPAGGCNSTDAAWSSACKK